MGDWSSSVVNTPTFFRSMPPSVDRSCRLISKHQGERCYLLQYCIKSLHAIPLPKDQSICITMVFLFAPTNKRTIKMAYIVDVATTGKTFAISKLIIVTWIFTLRWKLKTTMMLVHIISTAMSQRRWLKCWRDHCLPIYIKQIDGVWGGKRKQKRHRISLCTNKAS